MKFRVAYEKADGGAHTAVVADAVQRRERRVQRRVLVGWVDLQPLHRHLVLMAVVADQHVTDRERGVRGDSRP